MDMIKRVLNVGGGSKSIQLPERYSGYEHTMLDIDPHSGADIIMDARCLQNLEPGQFDAVYCSHNLEHYYPKDVQNVLKGFLHVLASEGVAEIAVPDLLEVMRHVTETNRELNDVIAQSDAGPLSPLDIIYGLHRYADRSGDPHIHKTGFSFMSLTLAVLTAGFAESYREESEDVLEARVLAFKKPKMIK